MIIAFSAVIFFSVLGFWKANPLPFMVATGASLLTGLYWYDTYTNTLGLGMGILLIAYGIVCVGFAFQCMFWKRKTGE